MSNLFLSTLTASEIESLKLRHRTLPIGELLLKPGAPPDYVDFPDKGLAAVVAGVASGKTVQVCLVGSEGIVGTFKGTSKTSAVALCHMAVRRTSVSRFENLVRASCGLRAKLNAFCIAQLQETQGNAACHVLHEVGPRVARLLLQISSRLGSENLLMTHEMMARLLATQRPTISIELSRLRAMRAVIYARGKITILSKKTLESVACDCPR